MPVPNALCTLVLARHGQSEWNLKGMIQGHKDIPLTIAGEKQAIELSKELKHIRFSAIFSSDLIRAKRTADIIALERQLIVTTFEALRERRLGQLEGSQKEELKILKKLREENNRSGYKSFKIESDDQMISRLITFLREIAVAYPKKSVLIITHGGVLRILLVHLGYCTYDDLQSSVIKNTAYLKLKSDGVNFLIEETKGIEIN